MRMQLPEPISKAMSNDLSIILGDRDESEIASIVQFCLDTELCLISYHTVDVSDCSYQYDTMTQFVFKSQEDTALFKLKYH